MFLASVGPFQIILILVVLVALVTPIIALIDILQSEFGGNNKIVWVVVVLLGSFVGAMLYYFIGRQQKIDRN